MLFVLSVVIFGVIFQILIEQNNVLLAADFLQNIVFINLQMNDEEKVHRFSALSRLYGRLGMRRKSSFFHRVAAMRCVAPQNPQTDWSACYSLLLKALPGYNIDFQKASSMGKKQKNRVSEAHPVGWPALQIQIMQELVGTSRRMGDHVAATRHMAFLIQALFPFLRERERVEMVQQLTILTSKSPGTPVPHAVEAGLILPPVNVYTVPSVTAFSPCPLPEPLIVPSSDNANDLQDGPFIFTPIQHPSAGRKTLQWVLGEEAAVSVTLTNPLSVELKIEEMVLMHEGVVFEPLPTSIVMKPQATSIKIQLTGVPKEAGELRILGYSCVVFGVRSHCRAKCLGLSNLKEDAFKVEISPPIPRLEFCETEEGTAPPDVRRIEAYNGEEVKVELSVKNVTALPIASLESTCQGAPVKFRKSISLEQQSVPNLNSGDTHTNVIRINGPATCCSYSAQGDDNHHAVNKEPDTFGTQVVTKYSGENEVSLGYFRQLVQKLQVTFYPSVHVTWWDVLPGESSEKCYLILDVGNLSQNNECEVVLGDNKHLAIDPGGKCRIPLPVDKVKDADESQQQDPRWSREKFFAQYLDSHVDLKWRIQDNVSVRTGKISLLGLKLSAVMMDRLLLSPLSWTVKVNGETWTGGEDFSAIAGCPISLEVAVDNNYKVPVSCRFQVEAGYVVADQGTGGDEYSAGGSFSQAVTVSGARTHRKSTPGGRVVHRSNLLATAPGQVCVRCFCHVSRGGNSQEDSKTDSLAIPEFFVNIAK